jgi:Holliday junction resolvasome RuvABC endonuclease subunit
MAGVKRTILGLDPSSTAIGWARVEFDGPAERTLAYGVLRLAGRKGVDGGDPWGRLALAGPRVAALLAEQVPGLDEAVVEVPGIRPSGKHTTSAKTMAIYGAAVGLVWGAVLGSGVPLARAVPADVWTQMGGFRGWHKDRRLQYLQRIDVGRGYDPRRDGGGDAGDAILLAYVVAHRTAMEGMLGSPGDGGAAVGWAVNCAHLGAAVAQAPGGPPVGSAAVFGGCSPGAVGNRRRSRQVPRASASLFGGKKRR